MCLEAGQHIIDNDLFARFHIPPFAADLIRRTWNEEPPAIYGRFDLAYDGRSIKLLEYNADTPTALIEAAVIQWYWLQDRFPQADQFNSIHERLVAKWKELTRYIAPTVHFAYLDMDTQEDLMTVSYLADTAQQGGLKTELIEIGDIGFDIYARGFVDMEKRPLRTVFKLYPWEWMVHEEFGTHLADTYESTQWMEPIWKMMWSNKALLAVLWQMYPNHRLLLPAFFEGEEKGLSDYVRKPLLSREGANISVFAGGQRVSTEGDYGEEGFIVQQYFEIPRQGDKVPVIGSWVVDGEAAGIGIRESDNIVTDNLSCFVPHMFR
jgi:glutathionylspermidine synthase